MMRLARATLTADDTASDLKTLTGLTAKFQFCSRIIIYPEAANEDHATNGPARVGDSTVDRVAAGGVKGVPLLPGILYSDLFPSASGGGVHNMEQIYIAGKTGDVFQIWYEYV